MEVDIQTSPKTNGQELSPKLMDVPETNGTAKEPVNQSPEIKKTGKRSRSRTPKKQPKKSSKREPTPDIGKIVEEAKVGETNGDHSKTVVEEEKKPAEDNKPEAKEALPNENLNGNNEEELKEKDVEKTAKDVEKTAKDVEKTAKDVEKTAKDVKKMEGEQVDMDPLVLNADEPDPELEFDENSDMESGSSSPVLSRCRTRRSLTRNIPTPKTPKSMETELEPEPANVESPKKASSSKMDHTYDSIDVKDLSTRAEDGGDSTRLDFEESMGESYLESCKNRSIRSLSARRSIRPNDDYLKRAIRNNREKSELNMPSMGVKRKNRSLTPEDRKRMRTSDSSSSLMSMFSSPFTSIRSKFNSEVTSSTPKLTSYKDVNGLSYADDQIEIESGLADKKSWCSLM